MWKPPAAVFMLWMVCVSALATAQSIRKPLNPGQGENIASVAALKRPEIGPELRTAIAGKDRRSAQEVLIAEINRAASPAVAHNDLIFLGYLFFDDAKYINAWIAWDKAEAIAALDDDTSFALAMMDVELHRPDRARRRVEILEQKNPSRALYGYWHARLDYDAGLYLPALARLQKVVLLDPGMAMAYDRMGLCYANLGSPDPAIAAYQRAVALNRNQSKPSAWPAVDYAVTLTDAGRIPEAITMLHEALIYNNALPQAHYQLGLALEAANRSNDAIAELDRAVALDGRYPEPHHALERILRAQGKKSEAILEGTIFQQLQAPATPSLSLDTH